MTCLKAFKLKLKTNKKKIKSNKNKQTKAPPTLTDTQRKITVARFGSRG